MAPARCVSSRRRGRALAVGPLSLALSLLLLPSASFLRAPALERGERTRLAARSAELPFPDLVPAPRVSLPSLDAFTRLYADEWLEGVVSEIMPGYGAQVRLELTDGTAADGLVHVSNLASDGSRVENVEDRVKVGETVKVRVARVDTATCKLHLTMRRPGSHRGAGRDHVAARHGSTRRPSGDLSAFADVDSSIWFDGVVKGAINIGVFVAITAPDGTVGEGMLHRLKMGKGFVKSAVDAFAVGDKVRVRIDKVDARSGKMGLTMLADPKATQAEQSPFATIDRSTWLPAKVKACHALGIFVYVTDPSSGAVGEGLVHVSKMRILKGEGYGVGDDVKVRVLSVDPLGRKMGLTMLADPIATQAELSAFETIDRSTWLPAKVKSIDDNIGMYVNVTHPDSGVIAVGLVYSARLDIPPGVHPADWYEVGDDVRVRIGKVDLLGRKMDLESCRRQAEFSSPSSRPSPSPSPSPSPIRYSDDAPWAHLEARAEPGAPAEGDTAERPPDSRPHRPPKPHRPTRPPPLPLAKSSDADAPQSAPKRASQAAGESDSAYGYLNGAANNDAELAL